MGLEAPRLIFVTIITESINFLRTFRPAIRKYTFQHRQSNHLTNKGKKCVQTPRNCISIRPP